MGRENATRDYFEKLRYERVESDQSIEWKNFGPGMSGYCERFWCHPKDADVLFMGPDMHVSYGSWDRGKTWQTLKDCDGTGREMKRVLDMDFSHQRHDFGMAIDWNGWVYKTENCGKSWQKIKELGRSWRDMVEDADSFDNGWYYQQEGMRYSELAVDPTDDNVWYVGSGDFWNIKDNHKSAEHPHGVKLRYAEYGHLWKTEDGGRSWIKISKGLPEDLDVCKIIVNINNNKNVIMATNYGVFISDDGGLSWDTKSKGLPNNLPRDMISYTDEKTGEFILYLVEQTEYIDLGSTVGYKGGIFKSIDAGLTWTDITGNLPIDLTRIHDNVTRDLYYRTIAYWFGIPKQEAAKKFKELPEKILPVFEFIAVNANNKDELYIVNNKKHDFTFGPGELWKTVDGGENWICSARYGVYWTNNPDEEYWQGRNNPTEANMKFSHINEYMYSTTRVSGNRFVVTSPNGDVYIEVDQQTLRSEDKGKTWEQIDDYETYPGSKKWVGRGDSNLPGRMMIHETSIKEKRLFCSGEHGLWQTAKLDGYKDNQAVALEQIEGQVHPDGAHTISTAAIHPKNPDIIYILMSRQRHRGKLRRTMDGGKTWEDIADIFDADNNESQECAVQSSLMIDPVECNNMYFCSVLNKITEVSTGIGNKLTKGEYGFYRSFDGGYTWNVSMNGFHKGASINMIAMDPDNPRKLYAAANDDNGGLYVTLNRGDLWSRVAIPEVIKSVNYVCIDRNNKNIYISTGRSDGSYEEGGVWRSEDGGNTWTKIFKAPFVWKTDVSVLDSNMILISVAGQKINAQETFMNPGIYLSNDYGQSWDKINKGLGQPDKIVDIQLDPYNKDVLWCASWGCGWFIAYLNGTKEGWLIRQ